MREIKFRAWLNDDKRMVNILALDFLHKTWIAHKDLCGSFDDIELMQYTGLKDKNGKEIYEGDIIKCKIGNVDFKGYVYFYGGRFEFIDFEDDEETEFLCYCDEPEVIGNTYENPELLEENYE